ncbi:hypothetical protein [Anabaena azotica]|uniref:Uncharacterized protein n=1 Tax=Anabaena azotica FACHB-119 TaxID=947527 RepID=A0ABR8DAQ1_9NOST|nr:hypothetical protein [Anabaena azotica]MBD2503420.1 hypothetical protein [Anabaena azotica FACHB-119]
MPSFNGNVAIPSYAIKNGIKGTLVFRGNDHSLFFKTARVQNFRSFIGNRPIVTTTISIPTITKTVGQLFP